MVSYFQKLFLCTFFSGKIISFGKFRRKELCEEINSFSMWKMENINEDTEIFELYNKINIYEISIYL